MNNERRRKYEFSNERKEQAKELSHYNCDICGGKDRKTQRLQIHHLCAIWFARETGIPCDVIKDLSNAMCLCEKCHNKMHLQENRPQYEAIANNILDQDVEADESLDAWRKDPDHPINRLGKKKRRKQRKRKGKSNNKSRR